MILAGDIGGTKTHLALFEDVQKRKIVKEKRYVSKELKNLEEIVFDFLSQEKNPVEVACFGVAGPVVDNKCHATNLAWGIDGDHLSKETHIPSVFLINDLEANAWGISCLEEKEMVVLNKGDPSRKGNRALISAGTGLGEAGLYWDGVDYHPFACEGGHCNFAPRNEEEIALWRFLKKKYGHVSYERVLSGMAIADIYRFLIAEGYEQEMREIKEQLEEGDPSRVISENALKKQCPACVRTMEILTSIYGAEAGNVALKFLSTGGLFIGGGIAPKIMDILKNGGFMKAYLDKGRFEELLSRISIKVILNENTALLGAAQYAKKKKKGP